MTNRNNQNMNAVAIESYKIRMRTRKQTEHGNLEVFFASAWMFQNVTRLYRSGQYSKIHSFIPIAYVHPSSIVDSAELVSSH